MRKTLAAVLTMLVAPSGAAFAEGELTNYNAIEARGPVRVEIITGNDFSFQILGADASWVHARVEGCRLIIEAPNRRRFWGSRRDIDATARVTMPTLLRVQGSDGAELMADGPCETLTVMAASGAEIDTIRMACTKGFVDVSSGASASVRFSEALDVEASSGADIDVFGNPRLGVTSISSGAEVRHR